MRPPRNELAITDMARHINRLKKRKPGTLRQIDRWVIANTGLDVSTASFGKAMAGEMDPTACQVELLLALCAWFEVEPSALGRFAEERLAPVLAVAGSMAPDPARDQRVRPFGWIDESPGIVLAFPERVAS